MAADQGRPERIEHGAHPRQALEKQFFLQLGPGFRHGHQGLDAGHPGATGPEVAAGVQGGEPGVQPGVVHQGREAIDALQQQLLAGCCGHQGGVFGLGGAAWTSAQAGQGAGQGAGGEFGGAASAGHGFRRGPGSHGGQGVKALHESPVNPLLPAPEPGAGAQGQGPPERQGLGLAAPGPAIAEELQGPGLGAPGA